MSNKYHYVYRITNTQMNKHYYGVRSSKVEPKLDLGIKYFSSSTDKDFIKEQKENKDIFKYKIIKQFNSREEAVKLEIKLHNKFDVGLNESFYNRAKQTSTGFDTSCKSTKQNNYRIGKTMMCCNNIQKFIPDEIVDEYISLGWVIGYLPKTKEHCANISKSKIGQPPPNKGIPCSDEQKKKISKTKTGFKMSETARKNIANGHKGLPGTTTNKIKINNGIIEKFVDSNELSEFISKDWQIGVINSSSRASVTGKILINNGSVNKYIFIEELEQYTTEGWNKGNFRSKKI